MRLFVLAAALLAVAPLGAAEAQPRPPHHGPGWGHRDVPRHRIRRHRVCRTVWYHHRKVRRCFYR